MYLRLISRFKAFAYGLKAVTLQKDEFFRSLFQPLRYAFHRFNPTSGFPQPLKPSFKTPHKRTAEIASSSTGR